MNFCSNCGASVSHEIPPGDDRPRAVCKACNTIHYENPRIIAGCLPYYEDQVLLCRRAIEPRKGYWTLPAGFMENGETVEQGAAREAWEEALLKIDRQQLYSMFSLPHINQVYIFYLAEVADLDFGAGPESLEVKLFPIEDIPWDELAFRSVVATLKDYVRDRAAGKFIVRNQMLDDTFEIKDLTIPL